MEGCFSHGSFLLMGVQAAGGEGRCLQNVVFQGLLQAVSRISIRYIKWKQRGPTLVAERRDPGVSHSHVLFCTLMRSWLR